MFVHKVVINCVTVNYFSQDIVKDSQVTIRRKDDRFIGHVRTHVLIGRKIDDLRLFVRQLAVGNARPKNRMSLGHVIAPQNHCVAFFNVGVIVSRLVDTKYLVKTNHSARHTETGIRVNVVRTPTGFYEFAGCISFRNGVLTAAQNCNACRSFFLVNTFELIRHFGEGLVPCHRFKLSVLIEFPVCTAHQRLCQTVLSVKNLGIEITFNTVQAPVNGCVWVAFCGNNTAILYADLKPAACPAETAYAFRPNDSAFAALNRSFSNFAQRYTNRHSCRCSHSGFQ